MFWLVCGLQLHLLGYKQELGRHLSTFHNFATTFSFLSPITGKGVQPSRCCGMSNLCSWAHAVMDTAAAQHSICRSGSGWACLHVPYAAASQQQTM
jgi:hypothetical protein